MVEVGSPGVEQEPMNERRKRWGDRRDAYWLRDVDGLHAIMPHLMDKRTDAEVFVNYEFDVTALMDFIEERNAEESGNRTKFFHCIIMGVARLIQLRPDLNIYVSGRRMYMRHKTSMAFIARRDFEDGSRESLIITEVDDDWCLRKVTDEITGSVNKVRGSDSYGVDKTLDSLARIPRPLLMVLARIVKILDFYGKAPKSVTKGDPNFCTVLLSNLGSIGCPSIYHHLNNYGTNSIAVTIGPVHSVEVFREDGTREIRRVVSAGITLDERIADGMYFARSLEVLQNILSKPELLDIPMGDKIEL